MSRADHRQVWTIKENSGRTNGGQVVKYNKRTDNGEKTTENKDIRYRE